MDKLLIDLFERQIETQAKSTEALTKIVEHSQRHTVLLESIDTHFSNGFRKEIMDHVSGETQEINEHLRVLRSFSFWGKIIAATVAALGTVIIAALKASS